jgi:hypothetical protein
MKHICVLFCVLSAVALGLWAHNPPYLRVPKGVQSPALELQNIALQLTADSASDRARAIDVYWKAYELGHRTLERDEAIREAGRLYEQLQGGRIARAALKPTGWEILAAREPVILTEGKPYNHLLLVISNLTQQEREFAVSGGDNMFEVVPEGVALPPAASVGLVVRILGRRAGPLRSSFHVESYGVSGDVPIEGEVRRAGHLIAHIYDAQGLPTPARVFLTGGDGVSHVPDRHMDRVMWNSAEHFFYADGRVDANLPEGTAVVEVVKGPEYFPLRTEALVSARQPVTLELHLRRLTNMNARGWYSGDEHIHGNYLGEQFITPRDDLMVLRAEDLNVGNMMVSNSSGEQIHDEQYFEGKPNALSTENHILHWNEEMRTYDLYGHLVLLNLKELVRPIYTGFPGTPNWEDYPSNYAQAKNAQDQGGFAAYAHPSTVFDSVPPRSGARESVVDVALGVIDALEVFSTLDEPSMDLWYKFLNCGFKLGISAGSDAFVNQTYASVAGGERVYVHTGNPFSYSRWIDGLRRGRAFGTVGPLLTFELDGQLPGHEFRFPRGTATLHGAAVASSWIPMTKLEIVVNGNIVATASIGKPTQQLRWSGTIKLEQSSWIAARVWGPENRLIADSPCHHRWCEQRQSLVLLAHTGPYYARMGSTPPFCSADRDFFLRWIDQLIDEVKMRGKFATEQNRQEVIDIFLRARKRYEQMPEAPAYGARSQ